MTIETPLIMLSLIQSTWYSATHCWVVW